MIQNYLITIQMLFWNKYFISIVNAFFKKYQSRFSNHFCFKIFYIGFLSVSIFFFTPYLFCIVYDINIHCIWTPLKYSHCASNQVNLSQYYVDYNIINIFIGIFTFWEVLAENTSVRNLFLFRTMHIPLSSDWLKCSYTICDLLLGNK